MADEAQYEYETHKRKYEEGTSPPPPPRRRPTGFSDGPLATQPPPQAPTYSSVPPPLNDFELAKQKVQELANRFNSDAKRSKFDDNGPTAAAGGGGGGFSSNLNSYSEQKPMASNIQMGSTTSMPASHGYSGNKKIEIPNGRVGVIIGKAGETIKYLQIQSGARIQVTRDADHDPNLPYRTVVLMGSQDQIAKAEQLITEVLAEADTGGSASAPRRPPGAAGSEQFSMKVPSNKVGLVIGKGGETIKNIQSNSGARVQVIPLHPPPGEMLMERTVQIDGTSEQIEIAKQMVNEVIENRVRNPAMSGGYSQQGYQARPPTNWAPQPPQVQQPGGYGYMQQPGAYPGAPSQYNQQSYSGYPPQATSGYPQNWDQSGASQTQQAPQGTGYDYYGQQPPTQQQPSSAPATDNTGYNYNQPPTSGGYSQQGYSQDGYGGGYHAAPAQPGYGQPPANPQSGYDQQHGYGSTPGYGNVTTTQSQDGHNPSYGAQGETGQAPVQPQQGYMGQPSPNPAYPTHGTNQPGYGMPPATQPGYGTPSTAQYGAPQGQRTPPPNPPAYGQPQQSPQGGYAQPAAGQSGYPPSQPPAQPGYSQPDAPGSYPAAATYGGAPQSGAYPPPYGAPPVTPPSYGQQPSAYYGSAYSQTPAYPADGKGAAAATTPSPATQPAAQPNGAATASP